MELTAEKLKFQKYPEYKDSGEDWLGEIPKNWTLTRLGTSFKERRSKVSDKDYAPLSVTKNGIVPQLDNAAKSNDGDNRKLVKKGDFVINSRSDRKGSSGIAFEDGSVSLINIVMKPLGIHTIFCNYLLKSTAFVEENYRIGHGIVADLWTTRYDEMKNIKVGIPTTTEQTAIAHFLDDKTAKIDLAIAQKEKLIALLKERKQIVIQEAVTGKVVWNESKNAWTAPGASKDVKKTWAEPVEVRDSGVEWIGEIPRHWEVKRFRFVFELGKGLTITKENLQDEGVFCVNYGEIHSKFGFELNPQIHDIRCVENEYLQINPNSLLGKGDFVFADTSEDIEGSGNFTYLNSSELTFAGYHTVIARPKLNIHSRFFAYAFDSLAFRNQLRKRVKGVKVYSITQAILKEPSVWLPSYNEQLKIVDYLDTKCQNIHQSISLQQTQITKLKEYKATLIDAAVTGKLRVPAVEELKDF